MEKITAIYTRVSTSQQSTRSQRPDLQRWVDSQDPDRFDNVKWFHDSTTGKNMDRPGWQKVQKAIDSGQVQRLVVWRLDRLGIARPGW